MAGSSDVFGVQIAQVIFYCAISFKQVFHCAVTRAIRCFDKCVGIQKPRVSITAAAAVVAAAVAASIIVAIATVIITITITVTIVVTITFTNTITFFVTITFTFFVTITFTSTITFTIVIAIIITILTSLKSFCVCLYRCLSVTCFKFFFC